jgi:hypothetical protein
MAKANVPIPAPQPRIDTLESSNITIARGSLNAGPTSFQIRNIASLQVVAADDWSGIGWLIGGGVTLVGWLGLAILAAIVLDSMHILPGDISISAFSFFTFVPAVTVGTLIGRWRAAVLQDSELLKLDILTNAASTFRILHKDLTFLHALKTAIEDAMQHADNSVSYTIDKVEQKIERIEANTTNVAHSPGANVIGGSANNATQTTSVTVQGLQDISALMALVQASNAVEAEMMRQQLDIIRQHLAGGAGSKETAKAAWERFVAHVGSIAHAGASVWDLVARISHLVA